MLREDYQISEFDDGKSIRAETGPNVQLKSKPGIQFLEAPFTLRIIPKTNELNTNMLVRQPVLL